MSASRAVRAWHRRLSFVVGIQLLLWTVSGFVFAWDPIDVVRGEAFLAELPTPTVPADLLAHAPPVPPAGTCALRLRRLRGGWRWHAVDADDGTLAVLDAASGAPLPELDADGAAALADAAFTEPGAVVGATRVEAPGGEYRARPVPAWRVTFDDARRSNVYVDARTGLVTAVRNDAWRRFDWLWMLHIMDYEDRSDFSHPLLQVAAGLGVATSASGLALALLVLAGRRRRSAT